jgi:hypothetical protein
MKGHTMSVTLTAADVFAPFTWVELESEDGYRLKAVVPSSEVQDYIDSHAAAGYGLSDLEEMPKEWTAEKGYADVDWKLHSERVRAFYAQSPTQA